MGKIMTVDNRLEREKEFHDDRFTEETRIKSQKFYSITKDSKKLYRQLIFDNLKGQTILEIGCATGEVSKEILKFDVKKFVGIDISDVAIQKSLELNKSRLDNAQFLVMDGADLEFDDSTFDKIVGQGVLHHLDFEKAIINLARVLKLDGKAIFFEPLGHNPLINLYRKMTPNLRSYDEKPLTTKELNFISKNFSEVNIHYYYIFTLVAVLFRNTKIFNILKAITMFIDSMLFRIKFLRKYAWIIVLELSKPNRNKLL